MFQKLKQKYKILKQSFISINWNRSWEDEKLYLDKLVSERKEYPNSYIYNSVFQYKAQSFNVKLLQKVLLNIICFFGTIFLILKGFFNFKGIFFKKYDGVYYYSIDNIPFEIKNKYNLTYQKQNEVYLGVSDLVYLIKILFKVKFNFIIFSSVVFRVSLASYAIKKYQIDFIMCDMEYSCASGILHDYCTKRSVKLYNYMHGEKVLTLRDTFSSFDRFYVWDEKYKEIFNILYTNSKIIVSNPWLRTPVNIHRVKSKSICYLLKGIEDESEITRIQNIFNKFIKLGYEVFVKDHPRQAEVSNHFLNVNIIDKTIPFLTIIEDHEIFIAQFSTILTQCYCMNIPFLIDDVSNSNLFIKLKERKYPLSENTNLISNFLNENINNNTSL